nr:DUF1016 N-terminal domain-containing protein [Actinobacillus pleuropneumoniae]
MNQVNSHYLREIRQFYLLFKGYPIWRTVFANLSWSHFQRSLKVLNEKARLYYLKEAAENNWSVRTLDRNISTLYYDRLLASQDQSTVKAESKIDFGVPLRSQIMTLNNEENNRYYVALA